MGLGRCGRWLWLRCTVGESGALVTADRIVDEIADGYASTICCYTVFFIFFLLVLLSGDT